MSSVTTRHDLVCRFLSNAREIDEVGDGQYRRYFATELALLWCGTNTIVYGNDLTDDNLAALVEISDMLAEAGRVTRKLKESG
jgi:hypothetical protein